MSQSIQPLRISKGTPQTSPTKMTSRPLSELSPMERRRNSPSFNQSTGKPLLDSSPFDSSPFASKFKSSPFQPNSPHSYWQSQDRTSPNRMSTENRNPRDQSPIPSKRSSIEKLKQASRVKNSTMFAREQKQDYDPAASPVVERPLAAGRPLSAQAQRSAHEGKSESKASSSPLKSAPMLPASEPQKTPQSSPGKSSLSKNSRYGHAFDPENGLWSEDDDSFADHQLPAGKSLHRHAKSVTFDAAPPEINEYEMATPDPSSVASGSREGSYDSIEDDDDDESVDRDSSVDRDDSFDASLEDTDKTPVVLPEDWRFMSPGVDNEELTARLEDPFVQNSSPAPAALNRLASPARTNSVNSNGERRPLPPLPPTDFISISQSSNESNNGLHAAGERASLSQRNLPSPPRPSSISKLELQGMSGGSMSLEDRLHLMMLQEDDKEQATKMAAEEQRERRLRRGTASPDRPTRKDQEIKIHEDEPEEQPAEEEYQLPKRISRESILRKVKSQTFRDEYSSPAPSSSPERPSVADLDPDTPLPSLGERSVMADDGVVIKQEEDEDSEVDVYAIPDMYRQPAAGNSIKPGFDFGLESKDEEQAVDTDDESHYSTDLNGVAVTNGIAPPVDDDGPPTPRAEKPLASEEQKEHKSKHRMSLPRFASMLGEDDDFGMSMSSYITPSPPVNEPSKAEIPISSFSQSTQSLASLLRPATPTEQYNADLEEPLTPESVIRRSISPLSDVGSFELEPEPEQEPEPVPEPSATIKAPGGQLKTRASLAPAGVEQMAQQRRKVSGEEPAVPPIPDRHHKRPSVIPEGDSMMFEEGESGRQTKRKSSLVQLDIAVDEVDEGLSFGIDKEFDRLIEAQKVECDPFLSSVDYHSELSGSRYYGRLTNINVRKQKGYLMRQNTKVVVASSGSHEGAPELIQPEERMTKSAGNSPVKKGQAGTWTTEPWNGRIRRKSIRQSAGSPMKRPASGAVPPVPGLPSAVSHSVEQQAEEPASELDEFDESGERGRLFVKVVGVKDLNLPLPRGERSYFALTLDNGLHCVTTAWLELGRNAPIGQEFELVVLNDLEFQLTLNTKIEKPKAPVVVESPTKKTLKPSTFSRFLASPKKRKELEMKQQEEAKKARQQELAAKSRQPQSAWDLLHNVVADDGSFARSYISLKDHETKAYGRPYTVDIPCFNEWAMEEVKTLGSSRSGRGGAATPSMQRRAPYKIGKLELQLLYVPKPKEARDEDMPKSMNACVRELAEAERTANQTFEGHLSQQGGDCPYWRRRFFRLEGSKLTAFHDLTRQPRATISLAKASKLIDDKSSLTQKETSGKGGSRRKSAFAAEEEGYMFVEEGFRVRFANGETIDFYADSRQDKEQWMQVLAEVVGKDAKQAKSWTDVVIRREKAAAAAKAKKTAGPNSMGMKSAPNTPARKSSRSQPMYPPPSMAARPGPQQGFRPGSQQAFRPGSGLAHHRPNSADKPLPAGPAGMRDPRRMSEADRRAKSRSMIF